MRWIYLFKYLKGCCGGKCGYSVMIPKYVIKQWLRCNIDRYRDSYAAVLVTETALYFVLPFSFINFIRHEMSNAKTYTATPRRPYAELEVGESFTVHPNESGFKTIRQYTYQRGRILGRRFSCRRVLGSMVITRTA